MGQQQLCVVPPPPRLPKRQLVLSRGATLRAAAAGQEGWARGGTSPVITPRPSPSRCVGGAEGGDGTV